MTQQLLTLENLQELLEIHLRDTDNLRAKLKVSEEMTKLIRKEITKRSHS